MRSTFNILFYINKQKIKKNGKCPVLGRITVDGKLTQFSVQEEVEPTLWSVENNCCIGNDKASKDINRKLEEYRENINSHYKQQVGKNGYVTAESLKNALLGIGTNQVMLLKDFAEHNREFLKSVGVTRVKATFKGYNTAYNSLQKFIQYKYEVDDIPFDELNYTFIENYDYYMRVNLGYQAGTRHNRIRLLKFMVMRAIKKEVIRKNPFADYHVKASKTEEGEHRWLSKEDLDTIMQTPIRRIRINYVRNLFIFACFTGLSFIDLKTLKWEHIFTDKRGMMWIRKKRSKTGAEAIIPLLDIPLQIIGQYKRRAETGNVFKIGSYSLILFYMQELRKIIKIEPLSFHMSRHSFATTVCLSNGVPIETLRIMMGHRNISTTQIYSKITKKKIDEDMQALEKRLGSKYQLPEKERINNQFNEYAV